MSEDNIKVKIIADSINEWGNRLTTVECKFNRFILAELNTHRVFSRNSASSRAIPVEKILKMIKDNPAFPIYWGMNQKGMQAGNEISDIEEAKKVWLKARDYAIECATELLNLGVHKQVTNRLLEPFMWHTAVISSTEWSNFYSQRCHPDAQPEFKELAEKIREAINNNTPKLLKPGEWHLPYIRKEDIEECFNGFDKNHSPTQLLKFISTARCARTSYLTQDGTRELNLDLKLYHKLLSGSHFSPFEHPATPDNEASRSNFRGWRQHRKEIIGENR